jgi:predicted HTH transcriptional regulator
VSQYIYNLLEQGESQDLDYKQSITDAGKIAKTLSAFANGSGGTLLIGVKDNRRISGVRDEDEQYMVDMAATLYCKPTVEIEYKEWRVEDKIVLECLIKPGISKPYFAKDDLNKWIAYMRVDDQTLKASPIVVEVMKRRSSGKGTLIQYKQEEKGLLDFLSEHEEITLRQFQKMIGGNRWRAAKILVNMICAGIVHYNLTEKREFYTLK